MKKKFLPYGRHAIDEADIEAVNAVLRSDWLTTGPVVTAFENAFAKQVGAEFAVSCSSGTAALHLAALALQLGLEDAVVVPSMTFLATANAVRYVGAEVAFADCEANTALMDVDAFASMLDDDIEGKIKAVFPVHYAGQCVDMIALRSAIGDRNVAVVEDASHAVGSTYFSNGQQVSAGSCVHSDMAIFSFHPVKTIAMGEGGMITTNREETYHRLCRLRSHGMTKQADNFANTDLGFDANGDPNPWYYEMPELGYNYRASDIHCALGLSQLQKLDFFTTRRTELADQYDREILPLAPIVQSLGRVHGDQPAWHLYVVLIDFDLLRTDRAGLMQKLAEAGIGSQVHYLPVHHQPYYRNRYGNLSLSGADRFYARALSLPLFPTMEAADVERVVSEISRIVEEEKK